MYEPSERIDYVTHPDKSPYRAEFGSLRGARWEGQIVCGHNPHLFARKVRNLRATGSSGNEIFEWDEVPRPDD